MINTSHITTVFVMTILFVASLTLGVQVAAAQELFAAPRDVESKRILQEKIEFKSFERAEIEKKREDFRTTANDTREVFRTEVTKERAVTQEKAEEYRTILKEELQDVAPEERKGILEEARQKRDILRAGALEKREEFKMRAKTLRTDLKAGRNELIAEIKTESGNRIKAQLEGILNRIGGALENFTNLLDRVHNKIAELEANDIDTTDASSAADIAEQTIQAAVVTLNEARGAFTRALESDNPRDYIDELKTVVRTAAEGVKDAHRALKEATKELKELSSNPEEDSTDQE